MSYTRPCNKCGERISIRQMPHGQWVAFDVATDDQHKCSKKKSKKIQKKSVSKKLSKETDYGGLSLEESNYNLNDYDDSIEQNDSIDHKIKRYLDEYLNQNLQKKFVYNLKKQNSNWAGSVYHFTHLTNAVKILKSKGISIDGPYPADTLFVESNRRKFDIIHAIYHDQGLIPFKMVAFDKGVNATLNLPFIRTSPDHGTAYDIAWKNMASATSMEQAILLAIKFYNSSTS